MHPLMKLWIDTLPIKDVLGGVRRLLDDVKGDVKAWKLKSAMLCEA